MGAQKLVGSSSPVPQQRGVRGTDWTCDFRWIFFFLQSKSKGQLYQWQDHRSCPQKCSILMQTCRLSNHNSYFLANALYTLKCSTEQHSWFCLDVALSRGTSNFLTFLKSISSWKSCERGQLTSFWGENQKVVLPNFPVLSYLFHQPGQSQKGHQKCCFCREGGPSCVPASVVPGCLSILKCK